MPRVIVICTNGWVFIGTCTNQEMNGTRTLKDASVIRQWGTSNGVGQLALHEDTCNPIYDPCGTVELQGTNIIATINCVA